MATFVIAHGGWGGGWEWTPVARRLRRRGHEVFTPTLTGLGDRRHLTREGIGLSDHIEDVIALLEYEQLEDVVLCGHSYSGMVVTGVADRVPERIALLAYLDAFVPEDGQSLADLTPPEFSEAMIASARNGGIAIPDELLPPPGAVPEEVRAGYVARLGPHPLATVTEPVRLSGAAANIPRAYVRCTDDGDMEPFGQRARAEGWHYRELATAHDLQLTDPDGAAEILDDLASCIRSGTPTGV